MRDSLQDGAYNRQADVVRAADGDAVVYCAGAYRTPNGKTAHGLVRFTQRYRVRAVVDPSLAGRDAGELLDGRATGIPIVADLKTALQLLPAERDAPRYFVVGIAPDGGAATQMIRNAVKEALAVGLNVDSGLHDFFSEDPELQRLAASAGVSIRDVRKTPPRSELHSFTGRITEVNSLKIAVLGTDSAIGKRTTAWKLTAALRNEGLSCEMIGTGQTAWMQGVRYGIILDSLINDFIPGELEHAILNAWGEQRPEVMVIEGQGSLMNPAYPGGFEILAACRPDMVVLQHAPSRKEYDGFPGFALHSLDHQIRAIEFISGRPVVAVAINHEGISRDRVPELCRSIANETALPVFDPVLQGAGTMIPIIRAELSRRA